MAWNATNPNEVTREQAEGKIKELATSKGIKGSFKVFYNDRLIEDPSNLPETVDMTKVTVSAKLDQA